MKDTYQAVVIGGGIVGASVLFHLAKFGWKMSVVADSWRPGSMGRSMNAFHPQHKERFASNRPNYLVQPVLQVLRPIRR